MKTATLILLLAQTTSEPSTGTETRESPADWPTAYRNSIIEKGWLLRLGTEEKVWFHPVVRAKVVAEPEQVANGLLAEALAEGTFLGCLVFERKWQDYRGQSIPAGAYSLHYALQPVSDDHAETAPTRNFCLLVPLSSGEVDIKPSPENLFKKSASITGKHPVVFPLLNGKPNAEKKWHKEEGDHWSLGFQITADTQSGPAPLSLRILMSGKSPALR